MFELILIIISSILTIISLITLYLVERKLKIIKEYLNKLEENEVDIMSEVINLYNVINRETKFSKKLCLRKLKTIMRKYSVKKEI